MSGTTHRDPPGSSPAARGPARTEPPAPVPGGREDVLLEERTRTRVPRRYRVLFHNDDYTTMEFVVDVLIRYFRRSATEAAQIMLEVHTRGVGVAGSYTREVAETKVAQVTEAARAEGFPLLLTTEPE